LGRLPGRGAPVGGTRRPPGPLAGFGIDLGRANDLGGASENDHASGRSTGRLDSCTAAPDRPAREDPMRSIWLSGLAAVVLVVVAGCASTVAGSPAAAGAVPAEASAIVSAENQAGGTTGAGAVDACALLSAADVKPVVGDGVSGEKNPAADDGGKCTWENQDTYNSVTVEVGASGSAPGGALPKWDPALGAEHPLPDGMRTVITGQVEFVAGDRDCSVQVATATPGSSDEKKAVELAGKVRGQL
jgi:hypothetical protein